MESFCLGMGALGAALDLPRAFLGEGIAFPLCVVCWPCATDELWSQLFSGFEILVVGMWHVFFCCSVQSCAPSCP